MAEIILSEYQGAFIKKDGICYEYLESTTDSVTDDNTGIEIFGSCELCLDDNSSSSEGVNNPPSASNWPSYIPITEGVSSDFDLSGVTFSDPEGDNITLTLTSGDGVFDLTSGGGVIVTGSGTGTITLSGSITDMNNYVSDSTAVQYTGGSGNVSSDLSDGTDNTDPGSISTVEPFPAAAGGSIGDVHFVWGDMGGDYATASFNVDDNSSNNEITWFAFTEGATTYEVRYRQQDFDYTVGGKSIDQITLKETGQADIVYAINACGDGSTKDGVDITLTGDTVIFGSNVCTIDISTRVIDNTKECTNGTDPFFSLFHLTVQINDGAYDTDSIGGAYYYIWKKAKDEAGVVNNPSSAGIDGIGSYLNGFGGFTSRSQFEGNSNLETSNNIVLSDIAKRIEELNGLTGTVDFDWDPLAGNAPSCIPEVACGTPNANPTINMKLEWTNPLVSATVISSTGSPTTISSIGHGLTNGDEVVLSGFNTECSVNAKWTVTVIDVDTFTIPANVTSIIDGVGVFSLVDTKSWLGCTWTNGETKEVYGEYYNLNTATTAFSQEAWNARTVGNDKFNMNRGSGFAGFREDVTLRIAYGTQDDQDAFARLGANFYTYNNDLGILNTGDLGPGRISNKQKNNTFTDINGVTYTWNEGNGW